MASYADSTTPPTRAPTPEELGQKLDEANRLPKYQFGAVGRKTEMRGVRWIWKPWFLLGRLILLAAPGFTGKGTFLAYVVACITNQRPWPDGAITEPRNVLWLADEDDREEDLLPRLVASKANLDRVPIASLQDLDPYLNERELIESIKADNLAAVIIDPILRNLHRGTNDDQGVRALLEIYVRIAKQTGAAIIGVTHHAKYAAHRMTGGGSPIDLVRGSGAITDNARVVLQMTMDHKEKDDSRIIIASKANRAGPGRNKHIRTWVNDVDLGIDGDGRPIDEVGAISDAVVEDGGWETFLAGLVQPSNANAEGMGAKAERALLDKVTASTAKGGIAFAHIIKAAVETDTKAAEKTVRNALARLLKVKKLKQRKATSKEKKQCPKVPNAMVLELP